MTTKTIDVYDAQIQLDELVSQAVSGTEVILMDGVTPVARLVPFNTQSAKRVAGLHAHLGAAWMSDDFDEPLPDEFWAGTDETAG